MALTVNAVAIDSITPHPRNVRQGDVGAIVESLKAHGQYRPIVVQKSTGHILAGNHTWKAARLLKWAKIDVTTIDVDDDEALRILLIDNRSNDLAAYDEHELLELLKELATTDIMLDGTGYTLEDLDDKMALADLNLDLTGDPIGDLQDHLNVVRIRLDLDKETADLFRETPGADDVARLKALLGVG